MSKKSPVISVCVPTFNQGAYIEQTLRSIMKQTYKDIEIIIGDNGSEDDTESIILGLIQEDPRIRYIRHPKNLRYAGNCNALIKASRGKYIAIYHSDDIYEPEMVEKEMTVIENHPDIAGVFTFMRTFTPQATLPPHYHDLEKDTGEELIHIDLNFFLTYLIKNRQNILVCPTSMIRKRVYEELNGYNEGLLYIEDQDMWTRILQHYPLMIINEKLINYRLHPGQGSKFYHPDNRDVLSPDLKHLDSVVNETSPLRSLLNRRIASDYNSLLQGNFLKWNYQKIQQLVEKSRHAYQFPILSRQWFFQHLDHPILYHLIKLTRFPL